MQKTSVIIPDVFYLMKQLYTNSLAEVRANAEVSIENLALISRVDQTTLKEMESGKQRPSLRIISMYHLLFKAPYKVLFADLCADMHSLLIERGKNLINEFENSQSLKSSQRIQAISNLVNRLNTSCND